MRREASRNGVKSIAGSLAVLAAMAAVTAGCSDVGDSSAVPQADASALDAPLQGDAGGGGDDSSGDDSAGGDDSSTGDDSSSGDDTTTPLGDDANVGIDMGVGDGEVDASVGDGTTADAEDAGASDAPSGADAPEAAGDDAGADSSADTGAADTGTADTGAADTGAKDSGAIDSGARDAEGADATIDSSAPEAGGDATEAGGALVPCTTAGQTNCVKCDGWSNGVCTATEAVLVQHDIDKHFVTGPGVESYTPGSPSPCYECLLTGGCLDDSTFGDMGNECGDSLTVGTAGDCITTLTCLVHSGCAVSAVSTCYCGTAGVATACQGNPAPGPINGACASEIAAGIGFPETDGTDITKNLTDKTRASGIGDQVMQCANSNGCTGCLQ